MIKDNSSVKTKEDTLPRAPFVFKEAMALIGEVYSAYNLLTPFDRSAKETYGSLPKFIAATCEGLKRLQLAAFEINYPALSELIRNGSATDEGMFRVHDAIYKLGSLNEKLRACKFLVRTDADREALRALTAEISGSLAIFTVTQFGLWEYATNVYMSVFSYCCEKQQTAKDVYDYLCGIMQATKQEPFGYEAISPYRDDMLDIDPSFVGECEEANFPLTSDLCKLIIGGAIPLGEARIMLMDHMRVTEEHEVKGVTPSNMISRMNLG